MQCCLLPSRSHYGPVRPQQQRYLLSCHQPVHHGRRCHLHGLTYGHPQQHHALWQLRRRPRKKSSSSSPPPCMTSKPRSPPKKQSRVAPPQSTPPPPIPSRLTNQPAAKTSIPKPVLCRHSPHPTPCSSASYYSVQPSHYTNSRTLSYPSRLLSR